MMLYNDRIFSRKPQLFRTLGAAPAPCFYLIFQWEEVRQLTARTLGTRGESVPSRNVGRERSRLSVAHRENILSRRITIVVRRQTAIIRLFKPFSKCFLKRLYLLNLPHTDHIFFLAIICLQKLQSREYLTFVARSCGA